MKTDKNFKLSKSAKRVLATIVDKQKRGHVKRLHIEAEVLEAIVPQSRREKSES